MRMLGTLSGRGNLSVAGKVIGEVDYKISRFKTNSGALDAAGKIVGEAETLIEAFDAPRLRLTRQDTERDIDIAVKSMRGGMEADVVFIGPDWGD